MAVTGIMVTIAYPELARLAPIYRLEGAAPKLMIDPESANE
jgi:hypothetical protein